jgi:lysophospholipase L1-like esterase
VGPQTHAPQALSLLLLATLLGIGATVGAASPPTNTSHLEGASRLTHVFEALAKLETGGARDDVRIVQYGDSHTASDMGVSVFRRALQARFGDGGRGFVSIGLPWKNYAQDGMLPGLAGDFEPTRVWSHHGTLIGADGCYGRLGVGLSASTPAGAWTRFKALTTRVEIAYARGPTGGSFDVFVDGARAAHVTTRAASEGSAWLPLDVPEAAHEVSVRTSGDGEVRIFGMDLDRASSGVIVDALGINGAQVSTPLNWSEACFAEQLAHASPSLVVLAYGTNEALDPRLSDADYERKLGDLLGRVARATPGASCLLLGPPDLARPTRGPPGWAPWPRLAEVVALQRKAAGAAGCAFYDQIQAMGGPGSIAAWATEPTPRALPDRTHLTRKGYAQVAASFARDLVNAYDEWRAQRDAVRAR